MTHCPSRRESRDPLHRLASTSERQLVHGLTAVGVECFATTDKVEQRAWSETFFPGLDVEGHRLSLVAEIELLGLHPLAAASKDALVGDRVKPALVRHEMGHYVSTAAMGVLVAMLSPPRASQRQLFGNTALERQFDDQTPRQKKLARG